MLVSNKVTWFLYVFVVASLWEVADCGKFFGGVLKKINGRKIPKPRPIIPPKKNSWTTQRSIASYKTAYDHHVTAASKVKTPKHFEHNYATPDPIRPPPYTPYKPSAPTEPLHTYPNPAGYGSRPAYNAYPNAPGWNHPQQPNYPLGGGGGNNININNIYTNTHNQYGGGFVAPSYPTYHYSSGDVGSGYLGFYLGYSLAKLTTPTYHHSYFYDGYTPRYDHYEIHHYYHNSASIPAKTNIEPNAIMGCLGDSASICPNGTSSLCTSNGAVLCVASAARTVPCTDPKQGNCVQTVIPCVNATGNCTVGTNTTLVIPCISTAEVRANITYVNNTIIVNQTTIINNYGNGTNLTAPANSTNGNVVDVTILTANSTTNGTRTRRDAPATPVNDFCVTILALPAERKVSAQEQLVEKSTNAFVKFLVNALGIS